MSIVKEKFICLLNIKFIKKYEITIISIIVGVLLAKFHSFETDLDSLLM